MGRNANDFLGTLRSMIVDKNLRSIHFDLRTRTGVVHQPGCKHIASRGGRDKGKRGGYIHANPSTLINQDYIIICGQQHSLEYFTIKACSLCNKEEIKVIEELNNDIHAHIRARKILAM